MKAGADHIISLGVTTIPARECMNSCRLCQHSFFVHYPVVKIDPTSFYRQSSVGSFVSRVMLLGQVDISAFER